MSPKFEFFKLDEPDVRKSKHLQQDLVDQLEHLLEFVQIHQPQATIDVLMEDVVQRYLRRADKSFPVPGVNRSLTYNLDPELDRRMAEALEEVQQTLPKATETHQLNHALATYLDGNTQLMAAYRGWLKEQSRVKNEGLHPESPERSIPASVTPPVREPGEGHVASSVSVRAVTEKSST